MMRLLAPGASLMSRLRFSGKFALLVLIFAIPLGVAIALLFWQTQREIDAAAQERRGIEYVGQLVGLLHAVQTHNAAAATALAGGAWGDADAASAAAEAALAGVRSREAIHGTEFHTAERAQNIVDHWTAVKGKTRTFSPERNLAEHRAMSDEVLDLMYFVAERSRLLLDPEAKSAYLQDASVARIPEMMAAMAQARAILATGKRDDTALAMAHQLAAKNFEAASRGFVSAFGGSDVDVGNAEFARTKSAFETSAGAFLEKSAARLAGDAVAASALGALAGAAIDETLRVNQAALAMLDREIAARSVRQRRMQGFLVGGILAIIALAAYLLAAFSTSMNRSMGEAMKLAAEISSGNLSHGAARASRDELGDLMDSLNAMRQRVSMLVARVKTASDEVMASALDVSRANQQLSTRTERQASSLEQMAASTEELTATVSQSSGKIGEAGTLVGGAASAALASNQSMTQALESMQHIARSSRKIGDITGVIDGIAFQTNILALNAAVEAARVGAEGRGFAVVAGEIRLLAQRSASSAREIRSLIDGTVQAIEAGGARVDEAAHSLSNTVQAVESAGSIMSEVCVMAKEQGATIEQISAAVAEISSVTQQNAAFVQDTSDIADGQEKRSRELVEIVGGFRLGESADLPEAGAQRRALAGDARGPALLAAAD